MPVRRRAAGGAAASVTDAADFARFVRRGYPPRPGSGTLSATESEVGGQAVAGWFDDLAKRSARRADQPAQPGGSLSRREVLGRSAVVAGVAWTAPMLMATRAAAASVSVCTTFVCTNTSNTAQICCPNASDTCQTDPLTGAPVCIPVGQGGGSCGNLGQGICAAPFKCNGNDNQCNDCARPNICGGEGAQCCNQAECFGDFTCTAQPTAEGGASFCRKPCSAGCNAGQECDGDFCAETCTRNADCLGTAFCAGGFCTYQVDGGVTCA